MHKVGSLGSLNNTKKLMMEGQATAKTTVFVRFNKKKKHATSPLEDVVESA